MNNRSSIATLQRWRLRYQTCERLETLKAFALQVDWAIVSDYSSVRNAIVHGDGGITSTLKDQEAVRAAAARLKRVEIVYDRILVDQEAARDFA